MLEVPSKISEKRRLAKMLSTYKTASTEGSKVGILPLQCSPIFLIHPIGGTIFLYLALAQNISGEMLIHGIPDPAIEFKSDDSFNFKSIHEMAECYVQSIQQIHKKGPYILGGASSGGIIAIEAARILLERGFEVAHVYLFDSWAKNPDFIQDENQFKAIMRKQLKEQNQAASYIEHEFTWLINLQWRRVKLLHKLTPVIPKNLKVTLFKAKDDNYDVFGGITPHPTNCWESENLTVVEVAGNHETMFIGKNAINLAGKLSPSLDADYQAILEKKLTEEGKLIIDISTYGMNQAEIEREILMFLKARKVRRTTPNVDFFSNNTTAYTATI